MDAGAPADVMSMALAKTVEAHGTKKRKHPAETTVDKLKAIALSKPPSPGSLIKQVQVMSLVDDIFLDLDHVFSSNAQYYYWLYNFLGELACDFSVPNDGSKFLF